MTKSSFDFGHRRAIVAMAVVLVSLVPAVATAGPDRAASSESCPITGTHDDTLNALRTCNEDQLQALFSSLPAGDMPAWGSSSRGYWRWYPAAEGLDAPFNEAVNQLIWHGKIFYTDDDGGFLVNRVADDRPAFPAAVYYGPARLDGQDAIIVDYEQAGDPLALFFRDEIRQVTDDLYLGFGWWNHEPEGWPGPDHITFILDFGAPELPPSACVICQPLLPAG